MVAYRIVFCSELQVLTFVQFVCRGRGERPLFYLFAFYLLSIFFISVTIGTMNIL